MKRRGRHIRRIAWLAALLLLLTAAVPAFSRFLAAGNGSAGTGTEICSATGFKTVVIAPEQSQGTPADTGRNWQDADCPFCLTHSGSFALLPSELSAPQAARDVTPAKSLSRHSPPSSYSGSAASPRAPPIAT